MERQRKLERCGWHFFRIRESRYYASPEKALDSLWGLLNRMGIRPLQEETEPEPEGENDFEEDFEGQVESEPIEDDEEDIDSKSSLETGDIQATEVPENIHEALRIKTDLLHKTIIRVLEKRPKFSCVREKMPTYILKMWNIRSRGKPREQFAKRVDQQISVMERKGYVVVYKSKNVRVKLGWVRLLEA